MEKYLIKYLLENEEDDLVRKYIKYFKVELDWFIYNYGDHMSKTHMRNQKYNYRKRIIDNLQYFNALIRKQQKITASKSNVFSCVSVPFLENDYNIYSSILQPVRFSNIIGDWKTVNFVRKKRKIISEGRFGDLMNPDFFIKIESLKNELKSLFESYSFKGAFFPTDQYFEDKLLIDIFKEIGVPTFIFVHGLPATYSIELNNRADYTLVWGENMRRNFINEGFDPQKVLISGCRNISTIDGCSTLRNTLDDVLIIPPSSVLWHQHTWGDPTLIDRSMSILYLYEVENVLKKVGVKRARFRVHPSLSASWTYGFLDHSFYSIDSQTLANSLSRTTLVIGATSSVLFDSLSQGVNYLIYEPQENNKSILGYNIVPPFNGGDNNVVARNEIELEKLLRCNYCTDLELLKAYISPFNVDIIKQRLL